MSDEADKNKFWDDAANRLRTLNQHTRGMGIDCPDILKIETTAESVLQALKSYHGDEKEVLFFAKMEPKTFSNVFVTLQFLERKEKQHRVVFSDPREGKTSGCVTSNLLTVDEIEGKT